MWEHISSGRVKAFPWCIWKHMSYVWVWYMWNNVLMYTPSPRRSLSASHFQASLCKLDTRACDNIFLHPFRSFAGGMTDGSTSRKADRERSFSILYGYQDHMTHGAFAVQAADEHIVFMIMAAVTHCERARLSNTTWSWTFPFNVSCWNNMVDSQTCVPSVACSIDDYIKCNVFKFKSAAWGMDYSRCFCIQL